MDTYIVGGFVRDKYLNRKSHDIDILICNATEQEFKAVFPEAEKVGGAFPVFLVNSEEWAFARTEKSTGIGHGNFITASAGVSIETDLLRRDLTINAGALCLETMELVCLPSFHTDIKNKVLRHCSNAFTDDPLRVFRVARFAATLEGFVVADETMKLMQGMRSELYSLPIERIIGEMKKAFQGNKRIFFEVLRDCNCLDVFFPELEAMIGVPAGPNIHHGKNDVFTHTMNTISKVNDFVETLALLCHDMGKVRTDKAIWPKHYRHEELGLIPAKAFCKRMGISIKDTKFILYFVRNHMKLHRIYEMKSGKACIFLNEMKKGLNKILNCARGDGFKNIKKLKERAELVFAVRLPIKFRDSSVITKKCVLVSEQARVWHKNK